MSSQAFRATSPAGLFTVTASSAVVAAFILVGQFEHASRVWGAALILLGTVLMAWRLAVVGKLLLERLDEWAWALMISHTVIIHIPRDLRILAEDLTPSVEIAIQVVIWILLLAYGTARLAVDLRRLKSAFGPASRYATIFLLLGLASAAWALGPLITLAWTFKLTTILVLCLVLYDPSNPSQSLQRFVSASQLGLMLMVGQFLVVALLSPASAVNTTDLRGIWRAGGSVIPPTQLSGVAGMAAVMQLTDLLVRPRIGKSLFLFLVSAGIMAGALGRGGILAGGIGIMVVLAAFRRLRLVALFGALALLLLTFSPWLGQLSSDILTRRQQERELWTLTGRTHVWASTMDLFGDRPWLGHGYVSGGRIGLLRSFNGWFAGGAHNAYLEVLLALGLVGATVLSILLGRILLTLAASMRHWWDSRAPNAAAVHTLKLVGLTVCLIVQGMFESGFAGPPRYEAILLFGIVFCCDALMAMMRRERVEAARR